MCNKVSTSYSRGVSIAKWSIGYLKKKMCHHGRKKIENWFTWRAVNPLLEPIKSDNKYAEQKSDLACSV